MVMAGDATDAGPLLGGEDAVASYAAAIAQQRGRLRAAWLSSSRDTERIRAQIRAVDATRSRRQAELDALIRDSTFKPDVSHVPRKRVLPAATIDDWLQHTGNGDWAVNPTIEEKFDLNARSARNMFEQYRKKAFGGGA